MVAKSVQSNEYARQLKTLDGLPKGFKYPLFNGWQAIQSQRKSGYGNTARAAREIVDNAIEAGADNVWIVFDTIKDKDLKPHQRKNTVTAVAFIDDGPGMLHQSDDKSILRYALSWGGGTHFEDHNFIGKFGFGLPNSSVNQTQFTEVYTRSAHDKKWNVAALDIRKEAVPESGEVRAGEVTQKPLPAFVQDFMDKKGMKGGTGTVVVWWNPDRLTVNQRAMLREHMEHDFQIVYRGLLDRTKIFVDSDDPVFPVDPTFLDPKGYLYLPPSKGGAESMYDETLWIKHYRDASSGQPRLELIGSEKGRDPITGFEFDISMEQAKRDEASPPEGQRDVGISSVHVRVSSLPYPNFVKDEGRKVETDAGRRFNIRKRTRGISFVRAGREIDTLDNLPKSYREETGWWPLLQGYAYYWPVDIQFEPGLDEAMGIGHDKQTVEPILEFWRLMKQAKVNDALSRANAQRGKHGRDEKSRRQSQPDADQPAVAAANQATRLDQPTEPGSAKMKARQAAASEGGGEPDNGATPVEGTTRGPNDDQAQPRPKLVGGVTEGRFAIKFFEAEGGVFMEPRPGESARVEAWINKKHPWYDAYANPASVLEARNATNLLLLALAASEIRATDERQVWLEDLRCHEVSPFLRKSSRVLKSLLPQMDEEEEEATAVATN